MKKSLIATVGVCSLLVGLSFNHFAMSDAPAAYKVAVVDVQQIVQSSAQVNALKTEQQKKAEELKAFLTKAQSDIAKESDATKRKALEDKYNAELNTKRDVIEKDYAKKLGDIDKSITAVIANQAKLAKYDLVLAKGIVIYGGTDITATVKTQVK